MKTHGTLIQWNDARGFGFVALPQSREEIFVKEPREAKLVFTFAEQPIEDLARNSP